jgi:hypothetical protein
MTFSFRQLEAVFAKIDQNNDGKVNAEELAELIAQDEDRYCASYRYMPYVELRGLPIRSVMLSSLWASVHLKFCATWLTSVLFLERCVVH